jgi:hypothetical protein
VVYKLEAKWKNQLKARCGDDQDAILKNSLAFSEARGTVGYTLRLEQFRNEPARAQGYLEDVVRLYHLAPNTTVDQAIQHLNLELKKSLDSVERWIDVRNGKLVDAIISDPSPVVAVVFGGVHAAGVQKLLERKGIGCTVLEPVGYRNDEAEMISTLHRLVNERISAQ